MSRLTMTERANTAVKFGHSCANGKRGDREYRVNAAMCYNLCIQIMGDANHFGGPARDLIVATFDARDKEVNPGVE